MSAAEFKPAWDVLTVAAAKGRVEHGHRLPGVLVALIPVREEVGGEMRESVGYLLASASGLQGYRPCPARQGLGQARTTSRPG